MSNENLRKLLSSTPRAVQAQRQIDSHPHGFRHKKERVMELIDFNDAYVDTVLSLDSDQRKGFDERLKKMMSDECRKARSSMFSDEQFEAIVRGLSREIAVYLGARELGFDVQMTSRAEDALGVDMVISELHGGRHINVDVKSPSAYRYRVQELLREGRITATNANIAEEIGYVREIIEHKGVSFPVAVIRVDANELGEIVDFRFKNEKLLGRRLLSVMQYMEAANDD